MVYRMWWKIDIYTQVLLLGIILSSVELCLWSRCVRHPTDYSFISFIFYIYFRGNCSGKTYISTLKGFYTNPLKIKNMISPKYIVYGSEIIKTKWACRARSAAANKTLLHMWPSQPTESMKKRPPKTWHYPTVASTPFCQWFPYKNRG